LPLSGVVAHSQTGSMSAEDVTGGGLFLAGGRLTLEMRDDDGIIGTSGRRS
jgi:hypothetical protein